MACSARRAEQSRALDASGDEQSIESEEDERTARVQRLDVGQAW